jgi:hypothetical protein
MTDYYERDGRLIRRTSSVPGQPVDEEDRVLCPACGWWYPYGTYHECPEVD